MVVLPSSVMELLPVVIVPVLSAVAVTVAELDQTLKT
jgi:hypothetical protein